MKYRICITALLMLSSVLSYSQNFSGLQNKRLNKFEDLGALLETGLGLLFGGKLKGQIDSVVVTHDAEKKLKAKIFYTGYENGFFTISRMNAAKQKQTEFVSFKFSQAAKASPVECTIDMDAAVPANTNLESAYFRIDVSKRENGSGNISVFLLNKKWKSNLDARNIVVEIPLNAVGKQQVLPIEKKDIIPSKTINLTQNFISQTISNTGNLNHGFYQVVAIILRKHTNINQYYRLIFPEPGLTQIIIPVELQKLLLQITIQFRLLVAVPHKIAIGEKLHGIDR